MFETSTSVLIVPALDIDVIENVVTVSNSNVVDLFNIPIFLQLYVFFCCRIPFFK